MDECRGSSLEKGEEKDKRRITRNLCTEMVRFCASSLGPGELAKKTSKWDRLPAFIANNHISLTITIISVSLALSRVTTSVRVSQLNEWIGIVVWELHSFSPCLHSHGPSITETYKDPPIFPEDDECWKGLLIDMEYWYSIKWRHTPRTVHSEVLLMLRFTHGGSC